MHEPLVICVDLLVSESAVTPFDCQHRRMLAAVPQRRKHMQAQLVEPCLLKPIPTTNPLHYEGEASQRKGMLGGKRLPRVALGEDDNGANTGLEFGVNYKKPGSVNG